MKHIFLSYSHRDNTTMQKVRDDLRRKSYKVWTDEGIEPGTQLWKDAVQEAIEVSGCLVVILSPDAKNSTWVKREIEYGDAQNIQIFSVLAVGDEGNAIPFALIGSQFIDIRSDYQHGIFRLDQSIYKYITKKITSQLERQDLSYQQLLDQEGKLVKYRAEKVRIHIEKLQTFVWEKAVTTKTEAQEALDFVLGKQEEVRRIKTKVEELIALYVEQQLTWLPTTDEKSLEFEIIQDQKITAIINEYKLKQQTALQSFQTILALESDQYKPMRYMIDDLLRQMESIRSGLEERLQIDN